MSGSSRLIMCCERLPKTNGKYKAANNTECNNGEGVLYFSTEKGWKIPDMVSHFYTVIGWYESA